MKIYLILTSACFFLPADIFDIAFAREIAGRGRLNAPRFRLAIVVELCAAAINEAASFAF
jgi:hypothetical protein